MDIWKNKYNNDNIIKMIDEIKSNFENENCYSVFLLISMLIEYLLNQSYPDKIEKFKRYPVIKEIL